MGYVQGVFFRDTCRREAVAAGVSGWVRNRADGAVEAVFEGEAAAVERMVTWTRTGPPRAHVERVEVYQEQPRGQRGFVIT